MCCHGGRPVGPCRTGAALSHRYAVYFAAEEGSALAHFGNAWLGGRAPGVAPDLIDEPRLYGFHATLKPPFRLAEGLHATALHDALAEFARNRRPFAEPPPVLARLDGFLAFRLSRPSPAVDELAAACVRGFDRFRAPLTGAERAKRLAAPLSERQQRLLDQWGYPYVLDQFRFHLTLTRRLRDDETPIVALATELAAAVLAAPVEFRSLCLFEQAEPGAVFALTARFPFGAAAAHRPTRR